MFDEFIFDLKVARKKSGLTQADCGHLVGASNHIISQIERGKRVPTVEEICSLSLIYGKSFESFYADVFRQIHKKVKANLKSLPEAPEDWPRRRARARTLERIARRIEELANRVHDV